ncbi:hypothetical protein BRADI_1g33904v3 [Brachypodium distachyon]|uniref:Uncharacterized protein n=1 Tax=Brachypodium distachyon TaxID=15368 RepID=A0A2K2DMK5_BRADI|nr:hypothetical protein BRADI_1g33904v3 [Brachypodium distachyon]
MHISAIAMLRVDMPSEEAVGKVVLGCCRCGQTQLPWRSTAAKLKLLQENYPHLHMIDSGEIITCFLASTMFSSPTSSSYTFFLLLPSDFFIISVGGMTPDRVLMTHFS